LGGPDADSKKQEKNFEKTQGLRKIRNFVMNPNLLSMFTRTCLLLHFEKQK